MTGLVILGSIIETTKPRRFLFLSVVRGLFLVYLLGLERSSVDHTFTTTMRIGSWLGYGFSGLLWGQKPVETSASFLPGVPCLDSSTTR